MSYVLGSDEHYLDWSLREVERMQRESYRGDVPNWLWSVSKNPFKKQLHEPDQPRWRDGWREEWHAERRDREIQRANAARERAFAKQWVRITSARVTLPSQRLRGREMWAIPLDTASILAAIKDDHLTREAGW